MNKISKAFKAGLGWGIFMYVLMVFVFPYLDGEPITIQKSLIGFVVWVLFAGTLYGSLVKINLFKKDSK